MTQTSPDARRPRTNADYRWTNRKVRAFIEALGQDGKVASAARAVGMTRQSAYRLKHRIPAVAEAWVKVKAVGRARRRGEPLDPALLRPQGDTLPRQGGGSGEAR